MVTYFVAIRSPTDGAAVCGRSTDVRESEQLNLVKKLRIFKREHLVTAIDPKKIMTREEIEFWKHKVVACFKIIS
jgi:hypothetical protein